MILSSEELPTRCLREDMNRAVGDVRRRALGWFVAAGTILLTAVIAGLAGSGWETPAMEFVVLVVWTGSTCGSFFATRSPKVASRILLWLTPLGLLIFLPLNRIIARQIEYPSSRSLWIPLISLLAVGATTAIPGLYWRFVSRRRWPLLLQSSPLSARPILAAAGVACVVFLVITISVAVSVSFPFWEAIGDCGGGPLLSEEGKPRNTDFIAKVVFVGPASFRDYSLWALARVEERYSDGPLSIFGFVILRNFFHPTDRFRWFFVEGKRSKGTIARMLPVIERVECGQSKRLEDAAVPVRVLRDGAPRVGVRIIGRVYVGRLSDPEHQRVPSSGIRVLIRGPSGEAGVVTDSQGIFDVSGLPKGKYTVELLNAPRSGSYSFDFESSPVAGMTFIVDAPDK